MALVMLGLNHRTASLREREQVVFPPGEAVGMLRRLRENEIIHQGLLLSTCNRTELYAVVNDPQQALERLRRDVFLARYDELTRDSSVLYQHQGPEAVNHLFRVSCGLDSMILGEQEILRQMKAAYEASRRAEAAGTLLHRLAHQAFRVGKRARSRTEIGLGAVSVAFAAVELAEKIFGDLSGRAALLVGAGENGALCARHLRSRRVSPLLITNRTAERATELAADLGGHPVPWEDLPEALRQAEIVVSTTGAPEPVITERMVREALRGEEERQRLFIDIAVPRDVDPAVENIRGVFRFDMESLENVVEGSVSRREKEVPLVEELIAHEVSGFMRWWESLAYGPLIRDLHAKFDEVRLHELERNSKRFVEEDREQLDTFSRTLVRKLLMGVATEIKQYRPDDPVAMERLAALRHVFGLDPTVDEEEEAHSG